MKLKTIYICSNCGFESPKWLGKCSQCNSWNTFIEDVVNLEDMNKKNVQLEAKALEPMTLNFKILDKTRIKTEITELDIVLGSGFVEGSLNLLAGEPGIGKSTLTLQICKKLCNKNTKILYIAGEESVEQISLRAQRLSIDSKNLQLINSTNLESILASLEKIKPDFIIVDSIQVISSESMSGYAGSISQIRYCAEMFMNFAKKNNIATLLIGHVTKDGSLAGPKVLEHIVDSIFQLEGDKYSNLRFLKALKNRFGATNEIGIFEMHDSGLEEVKNPSSAFIEGRKKDAIGSSLSVTLEGHRAFLIEVQALTNTTVFGYPKRVANGFNTNRLDILIAVLQKHANINLANQDIYINIVGGLKVDDPGIDLAVAMAIISSFKKSPLPETQVYIGELGLTGEIRKASQMEKRIKEAEKIGMKVLNKKNSIVNIMTANI
jgi:DNA repair protein RadA/Sms